MSINKLGGFSDKLSYSDIKLRKTKTEYNRKIIQQSYKTFEKDISPTISQVSEHTVKLLEDTVSRCIKNLLDILSSNYTFIVSESDFDPSILVVKIVDSSSNLVKKEVLAEDFIKMANYIEDIFFFD